MRRLPKPNGVRNGALGVVESLEGRAYLTGVVLGSPFNLASNSPSPVAAAVADVNSDGKTDLILGQTSFGIGVISVFISNGEGYSTATIFPIDSTPVALASGHLDNGTAPDIVAGTDGTPGNITVLLNNGQGNFTPGTEVAALDNNSAIAVGDFTNDGDADVLSISNSPTAINNAMLLLGNGTGQLTAQAPFSLPFGSVADVATGDFNGDGNLDFAVVNPLANSVTVFFGNGNGTFQSPRTYATGPRPVSIAIGDFNGATLTNGNAAIDIVTADSTGGEISFLDNNGSGGFDAPVNTTVAGSAMGGGPIQVVTANFTGTTTPRDLAVLLSSGSATDGLVLLGNGNGTFSTGPTISTTGGISITTGDDNGDGLSDVTVISPTQVSTLLSSPGQGTTTSTSPAVPTLGTVSLSPAVVSGTALNAKVPVVVTNSGTLLKGNFTVNLYADTGTTLDGNQLLVARLTKKNLSLKPGKKQPFNFSIKILPTTVPVGTYHLLAEVVDPNGQTNLIATPQTVAVTAAFIQPTISLGAVTPATIALNKSGSILVTVTDAGNVTATGINLTLNPSTDGVTPDAGIVLKSITQKGTRIPPKKSKTFRLSFKVTTALVAGSYYPYVLVSLDGVSTSIVGSALFNVT